MARKRLKIGGLNEARFKELVSCYLQEIETLGRSKKTVSDYQDGLKKFLNVMSDITVEEIDESVILRYQQSLKASVNSISTVNHYLRVLRAYLNWLYEHDYLSHKIVVKMVKCQETIKEVYTEEELIKLLQKPRNIDDYTEWRNWAIINWLLGTGNRINTVINLKMKDVDLSNGYYLIREQKNKKVSTNPLDTTLINVIKTYLKKCRNGADAEDYLFVSVYGEQMTDNAIRYAIYKYNHRRGVSKTSAHALRHTFAKMYIMNGGDMVHLQKLLGHSTLEMSKHYVNLYGCDIKKGFEEKSPLKVMDRLLEKDQKKRIG